jgi:tol-pal system protein YbgF
LALSSLLTGCSTVSFEEFAALQGTVAREQHKQRELTKRVDLLSRSVEGGQGALQASLVADMDYLRQEMARLQVRIEEESARRGGGSELADLESRLARMETSLGLAAGVDTPVAPGSSRVLALAPRLAPAADLDENRTPKPGKALAPAAAELAPQSADALFSLGQRLYKQKFYQSAHDRLEELLKRYPKDKRSDEAQFMIGDGLYAEKKYEEAILSFNQLVKRFPDSNYAPAALLKEGMSFSVLGDTRTAKIVLGKLVKSYPKSAEAKQAEKLMAKML